MDFISYGITPSLIHPTKIKIARLDESSISWDEDFGEPQGTLQYGNEFEIYGQIRWKTFEEEREGRVGDLGDYSGYVILREIDLQNKGIDIRKGDLKKYDKIIEVDNFPVDLYITEIRPAGHSAFKNTLWIIYFRSRRDAI